MGRCYHHPVTDWDTEYRHTENVFGVDPAPMLERHAELVDEELPALDVGCGQGRNSFFLARRGVEVHALDPSAVAIEQTAAAAEREGLRISPQVGTLAHVRRPDGGFGSILVFGLIPLLTREQVDEMVESIRSLIAPGGLVFITAFTTEDPKFKALARRERPTGEEYDHGSQNYLEPGELRMLFSGWQVIDYWEGLGPEHRHGDGPVERHGLAEAVFLRSEE